MTMSDASSSTSLPHRPLPLTAEALEPIVSLFKGQNSIRLPDSPTTSVTSSVSHHANNAPLSFHPPILPRRGGHVRSQSSSSVSSLKGMSWFPFSSSSTIATTPNRKPNNEVRSTVLNLVRDLVLEHHSSSPAASGILQSCAEACQSHSLSLSDILKERFIEGHSPLYWAIVKRQEPETPEEPVYPDLLDTLLKQSAPLEAGTVAELRQACIVTSDHAMFRRLSVLPQFTTTSAVDRVIRGTTIPPDDVTVELGAANEGGFTVILHLFQFHKRMMLSQEISHEFIARNRLWKISFMIMPGDKWYGPPPGSWCVSLSLQESSPPTWFDGQLSLPDSSRPLLLRGKQMLEGPRNEVPATQIIVPMDNSLDFATLQYSGTSFNPEDEQLSLILEAKLRKYDFSFDILNS